MTLTSVNRDIPTTHSHHCVSCVARINNGDHEKRWSNEVHVGPGGTYQLHCLGTRKRVKEIGGVGNKYPHSFRSKKVRRGLYARKIRQNQKTVW